MNPAEFEELEILRFLTEFYHIDGAREVVPGLLDDQHRDAMGRVRTALRDHVALFKGDQGVSCLYDADLSLLLPNGRLQDGIQKSLLEAGMSLMEAAALSRDMARTYATFVYNESSVAFQEAEASGQITQS